MKDFVALLFLVSLIIVLIAINTRIIFIIAKKKLELEFKLNFKKNNPNYVKPEFKTLTKEEIDDIHNRGKITPEEMVREWEGMGLCAPSDNNRNASWRCKKFNNCRDCLVDYANEDDEYVSFFDTLIITENNIEKG